MTGFGKAAADFDGETVAVEVSAVNHRYLDCSVRTPYGWNALEPVVKQVAKDHAGRGKLSIQIVRKRLASTAKTVRFDKDMARQYVEASKELGAILGDMRGMSVDTLASLEGVFSLEECEEDLEAAREMLVPVLKDAFERLDEMRKQEGAKMAEDLRMRVGLLRETAQTIEEQLPQLEEAHTKRLRERIAALSEDAAMTEERIAIEVAMLAEKADVTEELVRLKSHLDHASELLEIEEEPVGRRLDFLSQEIQREVNTLGVKTRDAGVTRDVLTLKSELEKIREQIQNIE
jgi:uncharacterized protein (TIGR00255 family)